MRDCLKAVNAHGDGAKGDEQPPSPLSLLSEQTEEINSSTPDCHTGVMI